MADNRPAPFETLRQFDDAKLGASAQPSTADLVRPFASNAQRQRGGNSLQALNAPDSGNTRTALVPRIQPGPGFIEPRLRILGSVRIAAAKLKQGFSSLRMLPLQLP